MEKGLTAAGLVGVREWVAAGFDRRGGLARALYSPKRRG